MLQKSILSVSLTIHYYYLYRLFSRRIEITSIPNQLSLPSYQNFSLLQYYSFLWPYDGISKSVSPICHLLQNWTNTEWPNIAILCAFAIGPSLSPLYQTPMQKPIQDGHKAQAKAIVAFSIWRCFARRFQNREEGPNMHLASTPFSTPTSPP